MDDGPLPAQGDGTEGIENHTEYASCYGSEEHVSGLLSAHHRHKGERLRQG